MFVPSVGDTVLLRDTRVVHVTDVADQDPDAYRTYSLAAYEKDGSFVVTSEQPVETIFSGTLSVYGRQGGTVVSDFSEIVEILSR